MKKTVFILAALALAAAPVPRPAFATCASGFTIYTSGQLPDFTFRSGVPETVHFNPWYVSFASSGYSCGIVARSTVPGVSIQQTYGCPTNPCPVAPAGQWTFIGDAYGASDTSVVHKPTDIPILFDGSAPPGASGKIEIAVRDNDIGNQSQVVIGTANVFVEAASATPPAAWFIARTSASNIHGDRTILDHPYLNAKPGAHVFLSHVRNPSGTLTGTSWNHPIAVAYDAVLQRWTILNVDGASMPTGLGFGVRIDPTGLFYCTPDAQGTFTQVLVIHPLADNNLWATVLVTPIGGGAHPIAVKYSTPYWRIVYADGAAIPRNTCFNVKAFAFTQYLDDPAFGDISGRANVTADWGTGEDLGGDGAGHTSGTVRVLQFDWAQDTLGRPVMVTNNQTPLGLAPFVDPRSFGTSSPFIQIGGRWSITHEDGSSVSTSARFNVWAQCAGGIWYPDADHDGWGGPGGGTGSCGPVAGYATKSGDCNDGNATMFPGAAEQNDGQDNQCPGELGSGIVDEISGTTRFVDDTNLCWSSQSGATSYRVARSTSRTFAPCSVLATTGSSCLVDGALPLPGQVFYYLVRAQSPFTGSWGEDSGGNERILACQ